ncbi:sialate:O-sulfotransferase 1-like [Palaemon carinicauda]|uniref:sialate:O-sulfotransferase 1-like n=1 Tax=Palaemon carinicauda TaxID=392227 RepID=UPI0035B5B28B
MKGLYKILLALPVLSSILLIYKSFWHLQTTQNQREILKESSGETASHAHETIQTLHGVKPTKLQLDGNHLTLRNNHDKDHLELINETLNINDDIHHGNQNQNTPFYRKLTIDYKRSRHVLWPHDADCSSIDVRFGKNISGVFLHSFPRSGNTWVRYLLEAATGIFTSSFYTDRTLIRQGYLGERDKFRQGTTIATKLHFIKHLKQYRWAPCITIIRNPARLFISLWSYVNIKNRRVKHTAVIPEKTFESKEFHTFIQGKLKKWLRTYIFALTNRKKIFPLSYELIREDPIGQTRRLLKFLHIKPDEKRLACLSKHLIGKVKAGQRQINPYTPEEEKQVKDALVKINYYLTKQGFEKLPAYDKFS